MAHGVCRLLGLDSMCREGSFAMKFMHVRHVSMDRDTDGGAGPSCFYNVCKGRSLEGSTHEKSTPTCNKYASHKTYIWSRYCYISSLIFTTDFFS